MPCTDCMICRQERQVLVSACDVTKSPRRYPPGETGLLADNGDDHSRSTVFCIDVCSHIYSIV